MARLMAAVLATTAAMAASAETRFTSFTFENDFFAGYDKHYTNGVQAAFLVDLDGAPQWLRKTSADPQAVFAIGQRIYTPTDKDVAIPDAGDRPYAGWVYVMGDLRTRAGATVDHLTVTLGMVGPASGARQTQNNIHRLLDNDPAQGWDTQVRNRATFMAGYERAWPAIAQARFGDHHVDLSVRAAATVGTALTYADVGAVLRYGAHSTYSGGPRVSRETFGNDVQAGFALAWPRARVGFTVIQRSKEFEGQQGSDRFGQLALSFAF